MKSTMLAICCWIFAQLSSASELSFVAHYHVQQGSRIMLIYDDGSVYYVRLEDSVRMAPGCDDSTVNLSFLTWYAYDALLNQDGRIDLRLPPEEVSRMAGIIWGSQIEYDVITFPKQDFGTVCYYAVKPMAGDLREARLVGYGSSVHDLTPKRTDQQDVYQWLQRSDRVSSED